MRIQAVLCLLLAWPAAGEATDTPSIDQTIANHIAARGGAEAIAAIETVVFSKGLYREPGWEGSGNGFMALARPYYKVVGDPATGGASLGGFMEGYDGAAWSGLPTRGSRSGRSARLRPLPGTERGWTGCWSTTEPRDP